MLVTYIDPPEGWRHGFPKAIPNDLMQGIGSIKSWLLEQGYPKEVMDNYGANFFYRAWLEEIKDES